MQGAGVTIAYEDVGTSGVPLILVHGHPFDRSMWAPQLAHFAAIGHRVIAPDLRGYGESVADTGTSAGRSSRKTSPLSSIDSRSTPSFSWGCRWVGRL